MIMKPSSIDQASPYPSPQVFKTCEGHETPHQPFPGKGLFWFYLLFAIAGAVIPWYCNIEAMQQYNTITVLSHCFRDGTATPLAASITTDFFIGTAPVLVWMCAEAKRMKMKRWWLLLPATFLVSFAFSCPVFLAMKEYRRKQFSGQQ